MKQIIGNYSIIRRGRRIRRPNGELKLLFSTKFASTKRSQQEEYKNIRQDLYNRKQILVNLLNLQD